MTRCEAVRLKDLPTYNHNVAKPELFEKQRFRFMRVILFQCEDQIAVFALTGDGADNPGTRKQRERKQGRRPRIMQVKRVGNRKDA